ncbi:MAG: outer membrane beta-barrel protein [Bacteroidetes bacterium]|nr:outer membrane beta-barrel protein [Bacteroidota bacterium]
MKKLSVLIILFSVVLVNRAAAQRYDYVQQGEFGITAGAAHYFGDLNTRAAINRPKPALGIFFRKQFGDYTGLRIAAHYAQLGYSDIYSKNDYQRTRNLSFNTNVWELSLQGDFNFFKFIPGDPEHSFTPYVTLGAGVFSFDPYAYLNGQKVFLRPLGTEGQTLGYKGRRQYSTMAFCFPLGAGVKYNISEKVNLSFEIAQRFTTTDYLDDVSTTYIGAGRFPTLPNGQPSTAALLQDRSYELDPNNVLGVEGRQRGYSKQKDQYIIAEVGITFNISSYRCPSAK